MIRLKSTLLFVQIFLFTLSSCEISAEEKDKLVNSFINYYNRIPDQIYVCDEGYLLNAQQIAPYKYEIEVSIKTSEFRDLDHVKYFKCTATLAGTEEGRATVLNHHCIEEHGTGEKGGNVEEEVVTESDPGMEPVKETRGPIELDNEVQLNTAVTSGEQFIAVPREDVKAKCVDCSSHVNPQAQGVDELANIGIRQLNSLEPQIKHSLHTVLDVERQSQVVNGIRYILILLVNYDTCSVNENESCLEVKPCKFSILEKPWLKLHDGSRYRAIISNNCTKLWQFGDDGVVVTDNEDNQRTTGEGAEDTIKPVHVVGVKSEKLTPKTLTDEDLKNIEEQIIPRNQVPITSPTPIFKNLDETVGNKDHVIKENVPLNTNANSIEIVPQKIEPLSDDKKKAIDELLNFFTFSGIDGTSEPNDGKTRMKRSFRTDLNIMHLAEKYHKLKRNLENAKQVYQLAQSVVDNQNEIDMEVKNRVLKEVINAEEETENDQHYYYIQYVMFVPCDKPECDEKDSVSKICNAVIDGTTKVTNIINVFCHDDDKKLTYGNAKSVAFDDPVLLHLVKEAHYKIETESSGKALKLNRIVDAYTQLVSGTVTKISAIFDFTNCDINVPLYARDNCTVNEEQGFKICSMVIHERHWLKEKKISYTCNDKPADISFSEPNKNIFNKSVDDPAIFDMVQEAMQYLESQSNRNNKQILIKINSVSTKLVSGFLTDIEFVVGYTSCTSDVKVENINTCKLLKEPLRKCKAKVWDRTWIENGRQIDVSCLDHENNPNEGMRIRKRSLLSISEENDDDKEGDQRNMEESMVGGVVEQDVNNPIYKKLAEESMQKYLKNTGNSRSHKVLSIEKVTTQVVSGISTVIYFYITPVAEFDGGIIQCESKILEQAWNHVKDISVNCHIDESKSKREKRRIITLDKKFPIAGGPTEQNPNNTEYKILAEESMNKYLRNTGNVQSHRIVSITKVTTQVVSGIMTTIHFYITPDTATVGEIIKCKSKIWVQSWLNKKDIQVQCEDDRLKTRYRRHHNLGGQSEKDPNDPKYKLLAEESFNHYLQVKAIKLTPWVLTVTKVTTQVVSGSLTRIEFTVTPESGIENIVIKCKSKIWEQAWLNKKDINVECGNETLESRDEKKKQNVGGETGHDSAHQNERFTRNVPGGESEKDPNDPKYKQLAEESLNHYLEVQGIKQSSPIINVTKVSTKVVSGSLTTIEFTVTTVSGTDNVVIKCKSKIWEQPWLKKKDINVQCANDTSENRQKRYALEEMTDHNVGGETGQDSTHQNERLIRIQTGGQSDKDPNDPKYKQLAQESFNHYLQVQAIKLTPWVLTVTKVNTQVVSGSLTRIEFIVTPESGIENIVIKCKSKIWEQAWLNKKDINVECGNETLESRDEKTKQNVGGETGHDSAHQNERFTRNVPGGESEKDPNDPKYKQLAEESLNHYLEVQGIKQSSPIITVTKVSTKVVSGSLTTIEFTVTTVSGTDNVVIKCKSKIWEQPWLKKKDINVQCGNDTTKSRHRRQMYGGTQEEDPKNPKFRILAEESMLKYLKLSGVSQPHSVVEVTKATSQLTSGTVIHIYFKIAPDSGSYNKLIECHSRIIEQPWFKTKEIQVECNDGNAQMRHKRHLLSVEGPKSNRLDDSSFIRRKIGSPILHNPKDTKIKLLAEESMQKFLNDAHIYQPHKVVVIENATSQVVSGVMYVIHFRIVSDNALLGSYRLCHSNILEKPWLSTRDIDVKCELKNQRSKRDVLRELKIRNPQRPPTGAVTEQDPTREEYKRLAKSSLMNYLKLRSINKRHKVIEITKVTSQVVSGVIYKIDFTAAPVACGHGCEELLMCHSEIWSRPWLGTNDVKASCKNKNLRRQTRSLRADDFNTNDITDNVRRVKRQADEDDYIDDDMKFYYADRAIKQLNKQSGSNNLFKIITIHAIQNTHHMGTPMVRMYIEAAETYCIRLRDEKILPDCEELDGLNHKLCHVRLWPDPEDELVVLSASVVCEDDPDFETITGISIPTLLRASLFELENSPDSKYKLVHQGEPQIIPSLDSSVPITMNFVVAKTNCTKGTVLKPNVFDCFIDIRKPSKSCRSYIWMKPNSRNIEKVSANCVKSTSRKKRSVSMNPSNATVDELIVQNLVKESLEKLEMQSSNRYKQRVLKINSYSMKLTSGKVTTIDFDVAYTTCLKYEWVEDEKSCEFIEHLPRRHCVSQVWERLWLDNGKKIEVNCEDEESPLETHVEFENLEVARGLADEVVKHVEAKYPNVYKQQVVRIFSLEKQVVAGIHYRLKLEVGSTNCTALSNEKHCTVSNEHSLNKFCRANVWLRPWTDHPPNYRVTCDYQEGSTADFFHHYQAEHLFHHFLATYKPEYVDDHAELMKRFEIFKANVRKMHEFNTHERGTATYGVTRFSDLTYEEFSTKYMGLKPELRNPNEVPMRQAQIPKLAIPDKFDWREYGAVTDVKDQGSCGSCWAFSVTGNIEGQWKMHTGDLVSLSEQELVDCDKLDNGCNGGLPDNAYRAIEQLGGLETENDYPYEAEDDKCSFNKTLTKVQISGAVNITTNETDMAKWLVTHGPISIGINANAMQFYMGGVSHPWKMLCNPSNLDHGVLIVGYGVKDYPLFHKQLPYWTIKNSWGKSWGEQGYYRVYRGDGTCGVNMMASSAVI